MIIFLYGRDSYRLKQNLEKITDEYKKKYSGLGYSTLDFSEQDGFTALHDAVKTVSFFDEKRLIVLKDAFSEAKRVAGLIKTWDLANDKQRILVFVENADEAQLVKQNKEFFAALIAQPNVIKYLELLDGKQLENWVVKEFKSAGFEADPTAIKKLVSYVGQDSWHLSQEIMKLANYGGGLHLITPEDIDLLVRPKEDFNIFQIVDAVAGKNKSKAATLIHNCLAVGEDPYYIFSMIVYQLRNLLRVKSLIKNAVPYVSIVKKTGLNPFVVKKTHEQCRNYDIDELRRLFTSLVQIDIDAKSGLMDMENGLYRFVFSL